MTRRLSPLGLSLQYHTDVNATPVGSESAGQAGTVTVTSNAVAVVGAASTAEAGVVTPVAPGTVRAQFGPLALSSKRRQISPKQDNDAFVNIVGAGITGQWATPDLADASVYPDGGPIQGGSGSPLVDDQANVSAELTGAGADADAGSTSAEDLQAVVITGAAIQAGFSDVQFLGEGVAAAVSGADSAGEAGPVSLNYGWSQVVSGAVIGAEASETGIDTSGDVSPVITGSASDMLTSQSGFVNLYEIPVTGAGIQGQAHELADGFGEDDLGISNSIDRFNGLVASLAIKAPCDAVAISNITLSGAQTVNGVAVVTGNRVLVTAQTDPVENGIYVVDSSDWERAADFDGNRDIVKGTTVTVATETAGRDPYYQVSTDNPITIGVTAINFTAVDETLAIKDGTTEPTTLTGYAQIFVDTADGDLKVKFSDGTVATIVVDT